MCVYECKTHTCVWLSSAGLLFLHHLSSPQPGNYVRTVHRTEQSFQACNDIVACFMERAKVEKQYAQQLSQWSSKWKSIVDSRKYEQPHEGEPNNREHAFPGLSDYVSSHQVMITVWFLLNGCFCVCLNLYRGQMDVINSVLVPWLTSMLSVIPLPFCSFPRAALWLPHEGMAMFLHLHWALVHPPLLHLPVTHGRGRGPGEDLAERDLSKENLLWVQGELRQQQKFFTCAETLVEKADQGPVHSPLSVSIHACNGGHM